MRGDAVAGRYARALFAIGAEPGESAEKSLDALNGALAALAEAARLNPELGALLRSPVIAASEKRAVLDKVLAGVLPGRALPKAMRRLAENFCGLLADRGRLPLLGPIARAFAAMLDARRHVVRGSLCTAVALDDARRDAVKARLERSVEGTLELDYQVDPAILGGVTIRLGDRLVDASLRTQLAMLRDIIKKGE